MIAASPPPTSAPAPGSPAERRIETDAPIDLAATMGAFRVGGRDPSMRITRDSVWRATRTPDGPATVRVRTGVPKDSPTVDATAWGAGARWALDHVHELIGVDDDLTTFAPTDRLIRDLHRHHPGLRFGRSRSIVEALIPTIIEQKVTSVEAHRSYGALLRAFGEVAPGPRPDPAGPPLLLRPDPQRLASLGYAELHGFGIERRRAEVILRVCRRASSLDRFGHVERGAHGGSDERAGQISAARTAIESLSGIGPWTSATVLQQAFGDADEVIVGDYHLPNIVAWNLAGEARATDARMLELLAPYAPHRGRVVRLLGMGGRHAPRRGPGRRLRTIAAI